MASLARGGPKDVPEIARELGLPVSKAEGILRILESQGYVEGARPPCRGCPAAEGCRRWRLTEKGKEAVRREETLGALPG